ncbi:hypothetical protein [Photobacterium leiognathi]|uniref:hypothetical protein n=1 Tax=Photobacterium leiognathi TaxID=553611 RepID=UPI0027393E6E|nr:hypothetical protein [Photobacterium leiognathi]
MKTCELKVAYPLAAIRDILNSTKLALIFTVTHSITKETKTFNNFADTIDEMCMNVDPVHSELKVQNPAMGSQVVLQTDGINIAPLNIEGFNKFMVQIAGFNTHSEMYVLNRLVDSEIAIKQ